MSLKSGYSIPSGFKHTQTVSSDVWVVNHLIGKNNNMALPAVDVYVNADSSLQKIIPLKVEITGEGQLTITFSIPYTGFALVTA